MQRTGIRPRRGHGCDASPSVPRARGRHRRRGRQLRRRGLEIDNLESAALPNKRAVDRGLPSPQARDLHGLLQHRARSTGTTSGTRSPSTCTRPTRSSSSRSSGRCTYEHWMGRTDAHAARRLRRGGGAAACSRRIPELRRMLNLDVARRLRRRPGGAEHRGDRLQLPVAPGHHRLPHRARALPARRADDPAHHHRARPRARPASTSTPARRSARASSSTTAPAS